MADQLKRIADALDGGDPNMGKPAEGGNLKRIADYIVENGVSGGSESDAFVIQIIDADWHIYFDKTYAEIKQAIDDGKRVYGTLAYNIFPLYRVYTDSVMFICIDLDLAATPMGMTVKLLEINENDEITTYSAEFEPITENV